MGDLLTLCPAPRVVRLGGDPYLVSELTIGRIRDIEAWARETWSDPMDRLRGETAGLDDEDRLARLFEVYDEVEAGPPCLGDPRLDEALMTAKGLVVFALMAIGQRRPSWTAGEAEAAILRSIESRAFADEFWGLWRAAWGCGGPQELARLIEGPSGDESARRLRWGKWYVEVCEVCPMHPDQFAALTVSQVGIIRNGGDVPGVEVAIGPGEDFKEAVRKRRERYKRAMERIAATRAAADQTPADSA